MWPLIDFINYSNGLKNISIRFHRLNSILVLKKKKQNKNKEYENALASIIELHVYFIVNVNQTVFTKCIFQPKIVFRQVFSPADPLVFESTTYFRFQPCTHIRFGSNTSVRKRKRNGFGKSRTFSILCTVENEAQLGIIWPQSIGVRMYDYDG